MSFQDFLDDRDDDGDVPEPLPLVHSTRSSVFKSIARGSRLSPRRCPVFDELLLYFFYGRPAYRVRAPQVHQIGYCPICFILKPNARVRIARVFPFDSGAVSSGRVADFIRADTCSDYRLRKSLRAARLMVKVFYKDNDRYLLGDVRGRVEGGPIDGLVRQYLALLKNKSTDASDDRRSAIEIQTKDDIDLRTDLLAIVLPASLLDEDYVRQAIFRKWGVLAITYPTFAATSPTEYAPVIRDRVVEFFRKHGILG